MQKPNITGVRILSDKIRYLPRQGAVLWVDSLTPYKRKELQK